MLVAFGVRLLDVGVPFVDRGDQAADRLGARSIVDPAEPLQTFFKVFRNILGFHIGGITERLFQPAVPFEAGRVALDGGVVVVQGGLECSGLLR